MIKRLPLNKVPKVLNPNEFYAVVARVFVDGASKNSGVENVMNLWQFKPSNKIRQMPLETVEDTRAYEKAFFEQLERNNRVEEFISLMAKLEEKYEVVNLICSCDHTYINDYCHIRSLIKLIPAKPTFNWDTEGYELLDYDKDTHKILEGRIMKKRAYDKDFIAAQRSSDK